jgi:hypothetical protein
VRPNSTDCSVTWFARRSTALGTGTTVTPIYLDPGDAVGTSTSAMAGTVNHTAEPTYTASQVLWSLGANQRASYRWVVDPGSNGVLIIPAVNLSGIGIGGFSATYASTFIVDVMHQDM